MLDKSIVMPEIGNALTVESPNIFYPSQSQAQADQFVDRNKIQGGKRRYPFAVQTCKLANVFTVICWMDAGQRRIQVNSIYYCWLAEHCAITEFSISPHISHWLPGKRKLYNILLWQHGEMVGIVAPYYMPETETEKAEATR